VARTPLLLGAAALALAAGPALAQSGPLTIYTSQPSEQMDEVVAAFNEAHPDIEVEVFRSGTTEVMSRFNAEVAAGAPQADVLLIADAVAMQAVADAGHLVPYPEAPTEGYDPAVHDPEGEYFGTKLITTGIVYNTDEVDTPPASWADLTDPEVASRLIMPSPLYSGAAAIHVATMTMQPEFGWDYYEALAEGGAVAGRGNGSVIEAVARGEMAYGILIDYMAFNARGEGSPVDFVFPEEGVTAITQPVGIVAGTDNPEAARAFVDWQLSEEAQAQSVAQGYMPLREGIEAPDHFPALSELEIIAADPAEMAAADQAMKERFAELFGG
jgi:iron(III) transport system substrate-binding protein